jgi:hypothetical protein
MKYLKPLLLGLSILGALILLFNYYISSMFGGGWEKDWKEDKENQILFANYDGGVSGTTIEILNNKTFRVGDGSFMGIDYKEGNFNIVGDTIFFDRNLIGGTKAVLRYNTIYQDTFLYVVNNKGKLDIQAPYRVHENTNKTNIIVPILKETEIQKLDTINRN